MNHYSWTPIKRIVLALVIGLSWIGFVEPAIGATEDVQGWLNWRGPDQNGTSRETHLIDTVEVDGKNHLWSYQLAGRGTPVIGDDRVFTMGYRGEGQELQEIIVCLDAESGEKIWEHGINDFISDIIYNRYAIGSGVIDRETRNFYVMTTNGVFACFDWDGKVLWQISMMERLGRLTFPNGRTGAPVIDDDLVIVRGITSNWGRQGPARDRFYAFDKNTGELVWSSTPGVGPRDSSFSTPVFAWDQGRRVFYCGTGCGNIVCVNARTGEPIWRYQFLTGGVNSSVLLHNNNKIIAIHGKENIDSSKIGRMVAIDAGWYQGKEEPVVLDRTSEFWRTDLAMFTSSAVLVGDRVYQVVHTGELYCLDVNSGKTLWRKKLSNSQLHASPLYADGKLYIPLRNGLFYILKPSDSGAEVLSKVQLSGNALGSPSVWNGKIYVHTTEQLYCFGKTGDNPYTPKYIAPSKPAVDPKPTRLQIVPSEVLLRPGQRQLFKVRQLNKEGQVVSELPSTQATWEKFIPATAKVRVKMDGDFNEQGVLVTGSANTPSAGAYKATVGNLAGTFRGRVLPKLPFTEDFESFELAVPHATEKGVRFAYPPLPWIGARFKWEVRSVDGNQALVKTLDRVLFQRALTFIGHPDMKNYTVQLDVMTDGNRRIMSTAGAINQRYIIVLDGNKQVLEVSSNHSILKVSAPFGWKPKIWYRLKTRVDVAEDGSGIVRAKAWQRDKPEPDRWTIEVPHKRAHVNGAPGFFGFSPQSQFHVYVDNISVTPNDKRGN